MHTYNLDVAHSGAFDGFGSAYQHRPGPIDNTKAPVYFTQEAQKQDNATPIIQDREYPQTPPHTYIPGTPGPLQFGAPLSDGCDPGVYAVSNALFGGNAAFRPIPVQPRSVFRRRRRGDCLSEWSNAFVTRVDPCECINPEETYTPFEVSKYRDEFGQWRTELDFGV